MYMYKAGEMKFKVEGARNTGKYCRPPWWANKKDFLNSRMAKTVIT